MIRVFLIAFATLMFFACKTTNKATNNNVPDYDNAIELDTFPVITWDEETQNLGKVKLGEKRNLVYHFTNTGKTPLLIELVTSCKCTQLDWPRKAVLPGEKGTIIVTYDSKDQQLGPLKKTIDVIANTNPIVVEAFFNVDVVE